MTEPTTTTAGAVEAPQTDAVEVVAPPRAPDRLARLRALGERLRGLNEGYNWAPLILVLLIGFSLGFRLLWLDKPDGALIFDEKYYVNAARVILGLPVPEGDPYRDNQPGLDPNAEHPPLAKLLMAATMRAFGDNAWGWRLPSVILGTLSIPLIYGITRRVGGSPETATLATFLYAFDNLVFVHSRVGVLDIPLVFFLLLGVWCYLIGRPALAGLALAAATLCKIGGLYGLGALVAFEGLRLLRARVQGGSWSWRSLRPLLITTVVFALAFPWLLAALDNVWSTYKNPVDHVRHIFTYGFALTREAGPQGQESNPWQWLLNEVEMTYLRTDVQVMENNAVTETRAVIHFRGAMNPYVIAIAPLALGWAVHSAFKRRDDLSFFVLALAAATYGPFWPAAMIAHRISYLFYFLPTIPAVAIGAARFLYGPAIPAAVRWAFIGAVLLGFYGYFPFRIIP